MHLLRTKLLYFILLFFFNLIYLVIFIFTSISIDFWTKSQLLVNKIFFLL